MRNLFLNPNAFYLVDTKMIHLSGILECPKMSVYPKRENVAVLEIGNHFFELEQIKRKGVFIGTELPIRESEKEFIDLTTFRKFPYEKDFDFENINLKSLRAAYRSHQIQLGDVSVFGIQKLYQGKITFCEFEKKKSKDMMEQLLSEMMRVVTEMETFFLQFEDQSYMLLNDFLSGVGFKEDFLRKATKIEFHPIEELPLKELKNIAASRSQKKKCLQFPKTNI